MMTALVLSGPPRGGGRRPATSAGKVLAGITRPARDAIIALNEMVTNAVQHSRSGLPGGDAGGPPSPVTGGRRFLAEVADEGPLAVPVVISREDFRPSAGRGLGLGGGGSPGAGGDGPATALWWFLDAPGRCAVESHPRRS